jgi:sugar lactone lactonase YvrE
MKNTMSNNKSRFLSILIALAAILAPIAVHARDSYLFASVNGNAQNLGGAVFQYTPPGAQTTFAPGLSRPRGLAIYHGDLYVATNTLDPVTGNLQSSIMKVTASGVQTLFATLSTVNSAAEGIAIDRAGNVFVVAFDQNSPTVASTIFKFTPDGAESTFGSLPGQGLGLAFDAAGNLFAADATDQIIFKFTPAGASSVFVGPVAFTAVQGPVGLAFDRSGNLWVTTEGNEGGPGGDAILVFAPDGTESTFATDLADPRGIAFDPSGDLFIAEIKAAAPGDILKFSTNGSQTVFASDIGRPQGNGGPEFLAFRGGPPPMP